MVKKKWNTLHVGVAMSR